MHDQGSTKETFEDQVLDAVKGLQVWCVILTVALVATILVAAWGFSTSKGASAVANNAAAQVSIIARQKAQDASKHADSATAISIAALNRLQAEASGECYRVDYLRWQIDHANYTSWQRDIATAEFLHGLHGRSIHLVGRTFRVAAQSLDFLPLTDCRLATGSPENYRAPTAIPFNLVALETMKNVLNHPPQPPSTK